VAVNPAGPQAGNVYITNFEPGVNDSTVAVISPATNSVIATVPDADGWGIAVSPTGPEAGDIYVTNGGSDTVWVIDQGFALYQFRIDVGACRWIEPRVPFTLQTRVGIRIPVPCVLLPVVGPGYARKGEATRLKRGVTMLITTLPVASASSVLPRTTARPPVPKTVRLPLAWAVLFAPTTEATVKLPGAVGLVPPQEALLPAPYASAKLEVPLRA